MTLLAPPVWLASDAPRAVLFTADPAGASRAVSAAADAGTPWSLVAWCIVGIAAVGASVVISRLAWRGWWREPPMERAYRRMAGELGLDATAHAMLRRLAATLGAEPVVLLLSESAFERAAHLLESGAEPAASSPPGAGGAARAAKPGAGALPPAEKAALLALRARVFAANASGEHAPHDVEAGPRVPSRASRRRAAA